MGTQFRQTMLWLWLICGLGLPGCGPQAIEAKAQKPALIINEFKLTLHELKQDLEAAGTTSHEPVAQAGEEPEWLSRLIERELLVQEAQRLGLDREPDFMRTIERFWKEALIKLLIGQKAQDIAAQVHVYEPELEAYYQRLTQETQARILSFANESSAKQATQATNLEELLPALGPALLDDPGWQWYTAGALEPTLEAALNGTEPGARSSPFVHQGRWIVVAVAERRQRAIEPLSTVREEIRRTIRQQKEAEAMERWIAELKGRAHIVVDQEAIATIQ